MEVEKGMGVGVVVERGVAATVQKVFRGGGARISVVSV